MAQVLILISSRLAQNMVVIQVGNLTLIRPVWNLNLITEHPYSHPLIWYL